MSAEVAELVDAQASGVCGPSGLGGSSPPFRTILLQRTYALPNRRSVKFLRSFD